MQIFLPTLFILAMLIDIIYVYHFILLSVALTFAGVHKVSAKQNLLTLFYCALFK